MTASSRFAEAVIRGVTQSGWLERVIVARSSQESLEGAYASEERPYPRAKATARKRMPKSASEMEARIVRMNARPPRCSMVWRFPSGVRPLVVVREVPAGKRRIAGMIAARNA